MTTQEAKKVLELYRPGAADAHDPEFAEALALTRQDPELKRWLEQHHSVQSAIRARFKQITVLPGLKEQIISEHKAQAKVKVIWWRQPAFMAAAAAVVLVTALGIFWLQREGSMAHQENFSTYRNRMVSAALRNYPMTLESADGLRIRAHLADNQAPNDYALTESLEKTPLAGCGVLSWRDKKVAMVCFLTGRPLDPGEKSDLFLFVVKRDAVAESPKSSTPVLKRVSKLTTASWSEGDKTYILATPGDESLIRTFF